MTPSVKEGENEEDNEFYSKYEVGEILGDGISSVVRRCLNKETGEEFAVKIIDKLSDQGQNVKGIDIITQVRTEVSALSIMRDHPNIITLKDYHESSAFMFLVFELAKGGELFDYLTQEVTIPERVVRKIMWQLLKAVSYIHQNGIVHRDLKPENILLDEDNNILLSDFGFAVHLEENRLLHDVLGTPAYFAPETLRCVVYESQTGYGQPVDLWACGVILYTLLVGQGPFWHRKDTIMYRKIMEGSFEFSSCEWDDISEGPKQLIQNLLLVDVKKRYTAKEALASPWFEGMVSCRKCSIMQNVNVRTKTKISFKTLVYTVLSMKKLYYTFHERYVPMTYKAVLSEPYAFKEIRKLIDGCAFNMYGHWVKRTPDQVQNRNALFANDLKRDLVGYDNIDGFKSQSTYSYNLIHSFLPRRPSFSKKHPPNTNNIHSNSPLSK